jgi:ElaB/YqjD/DUF883 family membrane-anchored ribosome-binding protein
MSNMSNTAGMSNAAREVAKEAKEGAREAGKAAADGGKQLQDDLNQLRDDVTRLTEQISGIVSTRGGAAWQTARESVEGVISDAEAKGQEAVNAVREVGDNVVDAIDESLRRRPYTTLALAVGIGFLFGATWRR